jgi:cell wall-associated NlpC family hydrolase
VPLLAAHARRAAAPTTVAWLAIAMTAAFILIPLTARPGRAEPSTPDLERKIEEASRRLEVVIEQYDGLREDMKVTKAQSGVLAKQIAPLERAVDTHRDRIGVLAATAYRSGGVSAATALLHARSGSDVMDQLLLLDQLARQQQDEIADLRASEERFDTARHTLETLAAEQNGQERQLSAKKAQIEAEIAQLQQMREGAFGADPSGDRAGRAGGRYDYVPQPVPGMSGEVVRFAYAQLGKPYRWAADGPDAYDCSGLVTAAYRQAGVKLPHNSRQQWQSVTPISRSQLRPGDLIFYYQDVHHVAMYMGGDMMVHAPNFGEPVQMDRLDHAPIYGFGRVG